VGTRTNSRTRYLHQGLRRRKDRPAELLNTLRYARSLTYLELGSKNRARQEWEKLYASAPDYGDVAQRLGLDDC